MKQLFQQIAAFFDKVVYCNENKARFQIVLEVATS